MVLNGDGDSTSHLIRLNVAEEYFEPGRTYHFVTIAQKLGHVHSADLVWEFSYHPLNPLTW